MSARVQLVFLGEVLAGFRLEDVQQNLGRLVKADEARLKALFSGRRAMIKRDLPAGEADRYVARLAELGAKVHVEPLPMPTAPAAPAPAPVAAAATAGDWPTIAPPEDPPPVAHPRHEPPAPAPIPVIATPAPVAAAAPAVAAAAASPRELALAPTEEEQQEIVCPKCGERQSKRILCRACATNMPMGIAAKIEEEERRRAERQAMLEARRSGRRGSSAVADSGVRSAWPIGFRFSARIGRMSGFTTNLWLLTALMLLSVGFLQRPSLPRMLLLGVGMLAVFFFSMRLTVLRCHDCDRHGWWALMVLVPYVGSLASLLITFLPGNPDDNEYGPPPPKGRWLWLFVAAAALAASVVMTVRAAVGFAERQAARQHEDAEEVIDLGDTGNSGGNGPGAASVGEAFQREYGPTHGHKAFAYSSKQAFGWVANAPTVEEAVRGALAQCDQRRQPYTPRCRVVNVNGQPVQGTGS